MTIHRLTAVLPLLPVGYLHIKHYKAVFITIVFLYGIAISAGALIPDLFWAAAIWLLHDLVGAGIWIPIQSAIIQGECREESRGLDLSKTPGLLGPGRGHRPHPGWVTGRGVHQRPRRGQRPVVALLAGVLVALCLKPGSRTEPAALPLAAPPARQAPPLRFSLY